NKARNRCVEAGEGANDEESASFSSLELADAQAHFLWFKLGGLDHVGEFVNPVDGAPVPIAGAEQENAGRVGEYRGRGDECQDGKRIRRQIHRHTPWFCGRIRLTAMALSVRVGLDLHSTLAQASAMRK